MASPEVAAPSSGGLRILSLLALVMVGVVVVLGAYTRLTDAGLGCPDWPGCYGFVLVPEASADIAIAQARFPDAPLEVDKAWYEMVHRYFATGLGVVLILVTISAWRQRRMLAPGLFNLCLGLLAMVCLQGAFGAWTVTLKLWPQVVTAHLLGGFATLSLIWLLCLRLGWVSPRWFVVGPGLKSLALLALALLVLQIALGGWVSSNYAALACPDFPTCHGRWWPDPDLATGFNFAQAVGPNYLGGLLTSEARIAIQIVHRIGAVVVTGVTGLLIWRLWGSNRALAALLGLALVTQLLLGILNVVLVLPLANATAHNAVAAITLLVLITVNYGAFRAAGQVNAGSGTDISSTRVAEQT